MAKKISRKKYQEVLRLCKEMCKNPKLPYVTRLRAAEIICLCYGLDLSWCDTKADRKTVKELVSQRQTVDKYVKRTVEERTLEAEQQAAQDERDAEIRAAMNSIRAIPGKGTNGTE